MNSLPPIFFDEAYQDKAGVWRWKSNDNVPFDDMLEKNGISFDVRKKCAAARDADCSKFLAAYRKRMENYEHSEEELCEMRAAFGRGTKVVNVITGKEIVL